MPSLNLGRLANQEDDMSVPLELDPYHYKINSPDTASTVRSDLYYAIHYTTLSFDKGSHKLKEALCSLTFWNYVYVNIFWN